MQSSVRLRTTIEFRFKVEVDLAKPEQSGRCCPSNAKQYLDTMILRIQLARTSHCILSGAFMCKASIVRHFTWPRAGMICSRIGSKHRGAFERFSNKLVFLTRIYSIIFPFCHQPITSSATYGLTLPPGLTTWEIPYKAAY